MSDLSVSSDAAISSCGEYRHWLRRRWGSGPTMGFIMLNPSTADSTADDPTIRRCRGFAEREGCGAILVANLFQLRATDPSMLWKHNDPIGPNADHHLLDVAESCDGQLIAAWGGGFKDHWREAQVRAMIGSHLMCLGRTKHGHPRHPLYVKRDAPLIAL